MHNSWRTVLLAGVSSIALVGAAAAADMRMPMKAVAPPLPAPMWAGFYAGIHAGFGWMKASQTHEFETGLCGDIAGGRCQDNTVGAVAGAHAGYNWQNGNTVFGLEADGTWTDLRSSRADNGGTVRSRNDWLSSVRGRLGLVAMDNTLFYLTGGVGFGGTRSGWTNGYTNNYNDVQSGTRVGWVAGFGGEKFITQNWIARLELLYYGFGTQNVIDTNTGSGKNTRFKHDIFVLRAGLSMKW